MSDMYSKRVSSSVSTFQSSVSVSSNTSPVRKSTYFRQLELSPFVLKLENDTPQWTSQTGNIFRTPKSSLLDKAKLNPGIVWKQTRVTVGYNNLGKVSSSSPATNRRERSAMYSPLQESAQSGNVSKSKPRAVKKTTSVKRAGKSKRSKHTNTKLTAAKVLLSDRTSIISTKDITNKRTKKRGSVQKLAKQKPLANKTKSPTNKIALSSPVRSARNNYSSLSFEQVGSSGKGKQTKIAKLSNIRKSGQKSTSKTSVTSKSTKKDGLEHSTVLEFAPVASLRNKSTQKTSASGKVEAAKNSPKSEKTVKKVRSKKVIQIKSRPFKKSLVTSKSSTEQISSFSSSIALKNAKAARKDLISKDASPLSLQVHRSNFVKGKAEAAEVPQLRKSKTRKHGIAYRTQKGSVKQVGKKPRQIKTTGNIHTENSQTPKSSFRKSSKIRSFDLRTVSPVKSGNIKSGLSKKNLDYSVTSVEEILDFVGKNNFDKIKKSTTKTGNNTKRNALSLSSPKLTNSRRKFVGSPKLLSSTKSTTARSKSSQNRQLLNLSTSIRKDTKDVTVNANLDNIEISPKSGKNAKKGTRLLSRKKQRHISDLAKSRSKRSVGRSNKFSISPLKKNRTPSATRQMKKKGAINVRKTEFVKALDIPVALIKRPHSDVAHSSPRKKSRISSSSLLISSPSHASRVTKKQSQKSMKRSSKSVPKLLLNRKHTELKQLKKDLKIVSTYKHRKSSSLSTSPTKNASNQSFVNASTRSPESESLSQKTAPGSAVVGTKVFSSPREKGVSKLSKVTRQRKALTSAKKKTSRLSVALQVKKSSSPAKKLSFGLSHKSGEIEFGQKENNGSSSTVHTTKAVALLYDQHSKHSTRKSKSSLNSAVKIEETSPSKFLVKNNSLKSSSSLKVGKHLTPLPAKTGKNKSRALHKRPLKDTAEMSQSKRQRLSDSPAPKKDLKPIKTGKQKSVHIVKAAGKQSVIKIRKRQSSAPKYKSTKIINRSLQSEEQNLLDPKVTPKMSIAKKSQKPKRVPKVLPPRKQTELRQLKKGLKKASVRMQRKSFSLSSSPEKNVFSQSFVSVLKRSMGSQSSLHIEAPGSAVVKKSEKKVSSSPIRKRANKLSAITKQKKSLTPAKKTSRQSVALRVNKSLSVAANTIIGQSPSSGKTDFVQMEKSVTSPSLKRRSALTKTGKNKKPRIVRSRKASDVKVSLVSPRQKPVTAPLVARKQSQKATSSAKQKRVGKKSEQSIIVESTDRANKMLLKKTVKVHSYNRSRGITQPTWEDIISVSPGHLSKYTNIGMATQSQIHARTQKPSRVSDINNTRHSKYTAASTQEMADTSLGSSKLISSGLGRKSLSSSHFFNTGYSKQGKGTFREWNIATPSSSAELEVDSYTRYSRINPSPVTSRTESHIYNTSITKKDRAAPSVIEQATTSSPSWTQDAQGAEHYRNVPALEVAASSTSLADDHTRYTLNTPSSVGIKSSTLLDYTKIYGQDMKEISSRQPSFQSRHSVATDLRNTELDRSTFMASSRERETVNFVDDDRKERFGLQAEHVECNGNEETEDSEELEENSVEDMYVQEDGEDDGDTIGNHSTHSQHCTIS